MSNNHRRHGLGSLTFAVLGMGMSAVAATGTSAAPLAAFDSFVASRTAAASAVASFSSFVSTSAASAGALARFNSNEPAGFVLIVR